MQTFRSAVIVALLALMAWPATAAPPAAEMYATALGHENTLRLELASEMRSLDTLRNARKVIGEYESIARQYPSSGYSDNALWQAGVLSIEAFERFGQDQDRDRAVRLLRHLVTSFPKSSLVARVPEQLAKVGEDWTAPTPARRTLATIHEITRAVLPDAVRITIALDGEVSFHDERIPNPERVFLDLVSTRAAPSLVDRTIRFDSDADLVRQVRLGRHPNETTRVVLDLGGIASYSVYPLYNPYRLVIDCVRAATVAATTGGPTAVPARRIGSPWTRALPSRLPVATASLDEARDTPAVLQVNPPVKPLAGGFSIARQLGLNVSKIVIDPGHGGHDPGAKGKGISEAELVLDIALRLEKLLTAVPGVEVILTRRTDEYVGLQERTGIANREAADLFLSIHANASANVAARGIETYFLNFASNLSAARVAARENAASGQAMAALPDFVKAIALNNKLDESKDFATLVQRAMLDKLRGRDKGLRDLGVKQAPFVVLIGAAMPSVLVEVSFVSNAQDVKLLKGGAYRQKIAEALYGGVRKYQNSLQNVAAVAQR